MKPAEPEEKIIAASPDNYSLRAGIWLVCSIEHIPTNGVCKSNRVIGWQKVR